MQILLATHNPGKQRRYQMLLQDFDVELLTLTNLGITTKVDEPFSTSQENALHKAKEYAKLIDLPVLAVDEEMRTNFLPENLQPGVLVRRLGKDLDRDPPAQEVIDHWLQLIEENPHPNPAFYWDFSIVFFDEKSNQIHSITVTQTNELASYISKNWNPGYPMSTFMSPKGENKIPYWDLTQAERTEFEHKNFQPFLKAFPSWIESPYKKP
jgi:inosine/xanthosine triphosphate pyrophosphatase family protein